MPTPVPSVRVLALTALAAAAAFASQSWPNLAVGFTDRAAVGSSQPRFAGSGPGYAIALAADHASIGANSAVRMRWLRANRHPTIRGEGRLGGSVSFFLGSDPKQWRTDIPRYAAVRYRDIYPGIDLVFHTRSSVLEYDWVVAPGADPRRIEVAFEGAEKLRLDRGGDLLINDGAAELRQRKPLILQGRRTIRGAYVLRPGNRVSLELGPYDPHEPLVIDPVLTFSTLLGGSDNDGVFGIAVDRAGSAYVAGLTRSPDFPASTSTTLPRPQKTFNATAAFVAKLNPAGTDLSYLAFFGGSDDDMALAIAVDESGNAYVTGGTHSRDFPVTSGAVQPAYGGTGGSSLPPSFYPAGDAFALKLNPAGNALVYSTFLGGRGKDQGYGVAVDSAGNAYVAGTTDASSGFPTTSGAFSAPRSGSTEAFIAKLNPAGTALVFSSVFGGSDEDVVFGLAIDGAGNSYVTGLTGSDDLPITSGALQTRYTGNPAAYVAKLNAAGTALTYATYLGGSRYNAAYAIAVDAGGSAYVTGVTNSADFPLTQGAFVTPNRSGSGDVFAVKLNPTGTALAYSSVFGGNGVDYGMAVALDPDGSAYITGRTFSTGGLYSSIPTTPNALQRCGVNDAFITKLAPGGSALLYSSHLGGRLMSAATAIALGPDRNVWVAGSTSSPDFPVTERAYQRTLKGVAPGAFDADNLLPYGGDAFVTRLDLSGPVRLQVGCAVNGASFAPGPISPGEIVSILGGGMGPETGAGATATGDRLGTSLADTRVLFDGVPAPLLFVRSDQINAVAPYALRSGESTNIQVEYQGQHSNTITAAVRESSPAIFTVNASGVGQAAVLNEDGTVNSPANPAARGSVISVFATGLGETNPAGVDGKFNGDPLPKPLLSVGAYIVVPAQIQYAGAAPLLVAGTFQINIVVPPEILPADNVDLVLVLTDATGRFVNASPGRVTIAVR